MTPAKAFAYRDGALCCDDVPVHEIAERFGTPAYVYSEQALRANVAAFQEAFAALRPQVCFAVKALSNVHVLRVLASAGVGADVVSGGELERTKVAGIDPGTVVFAGVAKSDDEIADAITSGVRAINIESHAELDAVAAVAARLERTARVGIRVNPNVPSAGTPEKTTTGVRGGKFGVDIDDVPELFERAASLPWVEVGGLHAHIGSPIPSPQPYAASIAKLLGLVDELAARGRTVRWLNVGGGFAADYATGPFATWADYAAVIVPLLQGFVDGGGEILFEPGRSLVASTGALLTTVRYLKESGGKTIAIVDTGMSHFMRVALYDAYHQILPATAPGADGDPVPHDIAGPVCESSDYLARDRSFAPLAPGDLLAILDVGAYGMAMASHYNSIPRPVEVLVSGTDARMIRRRETMDDLLGPELAVPFVGDLDLPGGG